MSSPLKLSLYWQGSSPPREKDGLVFYAGEDARPWADAQLLLVADGMGGDGAIYHRSLDHTLFDREQHIVGIEEPGWATVREVSQRMDFKMVGIPVDQGSEAFMDALRAQKPKIVFTTPSHQFPTGAVMQLETRIELLKWACETNAYIVEDDSCNEYRYNTSPIPSLQSLDTHYRVVYLCNASKVLSPSMRKNSRAALFT